MFNASPGQPDEPATSSRRSLILAAGAIVLATGELFLPSHPDLILAREGHSNGSLGGRHSRNRRGRDKRKRRDAQKDRERRKDSDPAPQAPQGGYRRVAMYVHNYRSVPVRLQAWVYDRDTKHGAIYTVPSDWGWSTLAARAADGSHASRAFVGSSRQVIVQFQTQREENLIYGENPDWGFPYAAILSDGMVNFQPFGRRLASGSMTVWGSISAEGVKVTRIPDDDDNIQFSIDL